MRLALAAVIMPLLGACLSFHRGAMPGEPQGATFAEVEGARVRYVDVGAGPAVVLLHGFASSLETWERIIPILAAHHRVLALDLKGFGWTDRPEGDYSPAAQARLVLALMRARGIERAAIVGHSWGAGVALQVALARPQQVSRLALYDAWVYQEQLPPFFVWSQTAGFGETLFALFYDQRVDERLAPAFYDQRFVTEELVEAVERSLERPGTRAAALAAVRGQNYAAVQHRYREIAQPALLLWGANDVVTPVAVAERLVRDLPSARLMVFPRCGHFPMIEAEARSTAELAAFLDEDAP